MSKYYVECTIVASDEGFGEYKVSPDTGDRYESREDILDAIYNGVPTESDIYFFGVDDELAELGGVEDIRGRIRNEPEDVYAIRYPDGRIQYGGIRVIED